MRYSFASASSKLPAEILATLSADVIAYRASGISALELPFNGKEFADILAQAEHELRALLKLPEYYHVLFLQGGASTQFSTLPMNLAGDVQPCDYVHSGHWSRRAIEAASSYCNVRIVASGTEGSLPPPSSWKRSSEAAYCHYTSTETAEGLQFHAYPETFDVPLVADMTADFLTRPIPADRFGLIYASAQKNLGAAGLTIVIVHKDLLGQAKHAVPPSLDYARQAAARSKINTPPTFAILVALRMLIWLRTNGGLEAAAGRNLARSKKLYAVIDADDFYCCSAAPPYRSSVSLCFGLPRPELDLLFLQEAQENGLYHLQGHPNVGGLRACIYNGITDEAVAALADFMTDFRRRRG
jgi:phosphoserine aminotransferase